MFVVFFQNFLPNLFNKGGLVQNNNYNQGGVVPGSGNKDTVPAMLTPGELVIPKNLLEGPSNPINVDRSFMTPVKSTARTPVGTPVKVKSMSTTTVLPTIKKPKPTQRIREGLVIGGGHAPENGR